jgi:hypothetical protein
MSADIWRVDIAGCSVMVYGKQSYDHLLAVNNQLARMKMALHKIGKRYSPGTEAHWLAEEGLSDV